MKRRFGFHLTQFAHPVWDGMQLLPRLMSVCQALEESPAFDTLWLNDHLHHLGPEGPAASRPESMMLLAAAAARTSRLRLGLLVASATFRHPALLVKMATTLDVLSGGRAVLGLGAGHPRSEVEHSAYEIPFPPLGERLDRLEGALILTRAMLRGEGPPNFPAPVGPLPVMLGGSGEQRLLRLVARYADMCNLSAPAGDSLVSIPHKLAVLRRHCEAVGREINEIVITYKAHLVVESHDAAARRAWDDYRSRQGLPATMFAFVGSPGQVAEQVAAILDAGVDEVIVELPKAHDPEAIHNAGSALALVTAAMRATSTLS